MRKRGKCSRSRCGNGRRMMLNNKLMLINDALFVWLICLLCSPSRCGNCRSLMLNNECLFFIKTAARRWQIPGFAGFFLKICYQQKRHCMKWSMGSTCRFIISSHSIISWQLESSILIPSSSFFNNALLFFVCSYNNHYLQPRRRPQ